MGISEIYTNKSKELRDLIDNDKRTEEVKGDELFNIYLKKMPKNNILIPSKEVGRLRNKTGRGLFNDLSKRKPDYYINFFNNIKNLCVNKNIPDFIDYFSKIIQEHNKFLDNIGQDAKNKYQIPNTGVKEVATFFLMLYQPKKYLFLSRTPKGAMHPFVKYGLIDQNTLITIEKNFCEGTYKDVNNASSKSNEQNNIDNNIILFNKIQEHINQGGIDRKSVV